MTAPDDALKEFAASLGFTVGACYRTLGGGVSCEVWRVEEAGRQAVIKRALAQLKVPDLWLAPVRRNATEWDWFATAAAILPNAVPKLIAHDPARGLFAMEFLDRPLWKAELMAGRAEAAFAGEIGAALARIHAATAGNPAIAARFARDEDFLALRLDPYLLTTARRHPDLAASIEAIVARTATTKLALMHGDVSPKNILIGEAGPIFLDAETACYGDPAFDLAFCLNHLMLKLLVRPDAAEALNASFDALGHRYLAGIGWEAAGAAEARAASLLPALMLARVDGKSPVEYLNAVQREAVRRFAVPRIAAPPSALGALYPRWRESVA